MDVDARLPELRSLRERILYRYGLRAANRIIVQTVGQQEMLRSGFGLDSVHIPMPCAGPGNMDFVPPKCPDLSAIHILWVGRICQVKRPDRLIEFAKARPEWHFDLVGPAYGGAYAERVLGEANKVSNITVHGPVHRDRLPEFYRNAACLCCTSDFEGFPNTFLEAWSHGLPVVSTFDPDGLIARLGLGAYAPDLSGLVDGCSRLLASPELWRQASDKALVGTIWRTMQSRWCCRGLSGCSWKSSVECRPHAGRTSVKVAIVTSFPEDPTRPRGGVEAGECATGAGLG